MFIRINFTKKYSLQEGYVYTFTCLLYRISLNMNQLICDSNLDCFCSKIFQQRIKNNGHGSFFYTNFGNYGLNLCKRQCYIQHIVCKLFVYTSDAILTHSIMIMTAIAITTFHRISQCIKCQLKIYHLQIFFAGEMNFSMISQSNTLCFCTCRSVPRKCYLIQVYEIDNDACTLEKWNLYLFQFCMELA